MASPRWEFSTKRHIYPSTHTHWVRKLQLLPYSCLSNPMDIGAWRATVIGLQNIGCDWGTEHTPYRVSPFVKILHYGSFIIFNSPILIQYYYYHYCFNLYTSRSTHCDVNFHWFGQIQNVTCPTLQSYIKLFYCPQIPCASHPPQSLPNTDQVTIAITIVSPFHILTSKESSDLTSIYNLWKIFTWYFSYPHIV